jgi:two-component system, LytTR family, response regulator
MNKIRVVVVDDEKPARTRIVELLEKQPDVEIAGAARDGREGLQLIRSTSPHLLFLDIQMPDMNGFEMLREIADEHRPRTVFVTGYDRYAITAFEAQALDYLLKPFSDERFEATLQRARNHIRTQSIRERDPVPHTVPKDQPGSAEDAQYFERIVIKSSGRVIFLDVADIDWIEAAGVYVYLHLGPKAYLYRATIGQLLERLDPHRFVRVHRSTIVNTSRITELKPRTHGDYVVFLKGGVELTLSRGYRAQLEGWLRQPL